MSSRLKSIAILLIMLVILLAGSIGVSPALSPRDTDIIKIAFINGYLAALKLDPADAERLKKDQTVLRQTVENEVTRYLALINSMNK